MAQNGWACELALLNVARRAASQRERKRTPTERGRRLCTTGIGTLASWTESEDRGCLTRSANTGETSRSPVATEVADSPRFVGKLAWIQRSGKQTKTCRRR